METHARSIVKSIVWRVIGVVLLLIITYFTTKNLKEMTIITVLFHGSRVFMYYYHERIWLKVKWGRIKHPLEDIPVKEKLSPEHLIVVQDKLRELGVV